MYTVKIDSFSVLHEEYDALKDLPRTKTIVTLEDEGGGNYLKIEQDEDTITLDFEELALIVSGIEKYFGGRITHAS